MSKRLLVLALLLTSWTGVAPARAQPGPRDYRRLVVEALREFDAEHWEEARALFRRAHELYPNARSARGIGMAAFELRDYVEAHDMLTAALASETRPLTATLRRDTEGLLGRTLAFVGRFRFAVEPANAELLVDGAPPAPRADGAVLLPLGDHEVTARLEGYAPLTRRLTVRGAEEETIHLALLPPSPAAPAEAPPPPAGDETLLWAGVGVLLASAAPLGATLGGVGWVLDRDGELARCQGVPSHRACLNEGVLASEHDASIGFTVAAAIVTALAIGSGLALVILAIGEDDGDAAFRCAPGWMGAACDARF